MVKGTGLTDKQARVLRSIAFPRSDDEPFPHVATVKALERRGYVRLVKARELPASASPMDIILSALGSERIVATPAGRAALAERGGAE